MAVIPLIGLPVMASEMACDTIFMTWTAEVGEEKPLLVAVNDYSNGATGRETFCVDWGDGTYLTSTAVFDTSFTKTYAEGGSYAVMVYTTAPEVRINRFDCNGTWKKSNGVTSLDVTQNAELQILDCCNNQLTSLDVTWNANLVGLSCGGNQLTSLDVTRNANLEGVFCDANQLTSLDVTQNAELRILCCSMNQLTSLDVSQNPALDLFECDDNMWIVDLDADNGLDLDTLPGMDASRIGSVTGGYMEGTRLFFNARNVTYRYATHFPGDISFGFDTVEFVLMASAPLMPPVDTTANESSLTALPFAYVQGRTAYLADDLGEVEAFAATGQRVYRGSDRSITLPRPGVYVLRVVADGRRSKVVVR